MNDKKILDQGYKVYTDIFKYKLPSAAFLIFFYFSNYYNINEIIKISHEKIAKKCNISLNTSQRAINDLVSNNLILKKTLYDKNEYHLIDIKSEYFTLKESIHPFKLSKAELYIYSAIVSKATSQISYNEIILITNLSRATVINKIKSLQDKGLISIEKTYDSNRVSLSNNYIIL